MKKIILTISLSLLSLNVFATHAYRSQDCGVGNIQFNYTGNYPVGGYYAMSINEGESSLLQDAEYADEPENQFQFVSSVILEHQETKHECYFDHEESKTETVVQFLTLTKENEEKFNIKNGDKLTMICEETFDYPNGDTCGDDQN